MTNIYDTANQLEREVRELPEFAALTAAFEKLQEDGNAYKAFTDFQDVQKELHEKQMSGEDFTEEDMERAQATAMKAQEEPLINELMMKEQAFSMIVNDLNRIIMKPVQDLYER